MTIISSANFPRNFHMAAQQPRPTPILLSDIGMKFLKLLADYTIYGRPEAEQKEFLTLTGLKKGVDINGKPIENLQNQPEDKRLTSVQKIA